jgi:beta-phosphoglucomutase-like phosphatase (HAD superfamily)
VIIDSNPLHRQAWAAFNRRYGLETTEAMQRRMYGKRNDQIVRDYFGDGISPEEVDARGRAKERLYREMLTGRTEEMLVPGLRAFLERYRDLPMGVGSNAEPENIALVLDETGLRRYFRAVVDGATRSPIPKFTCGWRSCWKPIRRSAWFLRIPTLGRRPPWRPGCELLASVLLTITCLVLP